MLITNPFNPPFQQQKKKASVPKHASKFLSQVGYILGTCTYVFEHGRLLSVMNAKLIEDLISIDNYFWPYMLIHAFSLVLTSGEQVQKFFLIFSAHVSSRHFLHPLLAGRLTSKSIPIQKSAPHANIQELRPSVKSASHLSIIRVY